MVSPVRTLQHCELASSVVRSATKDPNRVSLLVIALLCRHRRYYAEQTIEAESMSVSAAGEALLLQYTTTDVWNILK